MVLVPIGVSMHSWTKSINPSSNKKPDQESFRNESGSGSFKRVHSETHGLKQKLKKDRMGSMIRPKIVSPIKQVLDQTKEKEKLADAPDTVGVSFNMASTSTGMASKQKKSKTGSLSSVKKPKKSSTGSTIKRLQRKRNGQSNKTLGSNKKSSSSPAVLKKKTKSK